MKRIIFLFVFLALTAVSGFSQADLQTVATVNLIRTEHITVRQLRTELERMERTAAAVGQSFSNNDRRRVLDAMINERLAIQAAERDRVIVSENEVNQQIQQLRSVLAQQLGRQPTEAEFAQAVRNESGLDVPAFREQLHRQMIVQKYLMTKKETLINSVRQPTDAEIRTEFNLRRAQFVRPETVEFASIQILFGPDAASRTNARQLAERLVREIGSDPSRFDSVAERSQAPNSGYNAYIGTSVPMVPEAQATFGQDFMDTAFNLKQGEVSRVIETTNEYLIIKVTRNLEFKNLDLDDNVPAHILMSVGVDPRNTVTVRNFLGAMIANEKQQAVINQATEELAAELRAGRSFTVFERNLPW